MKCKFYVGQEVVCINDDWSNWHPENYNDIPNRPIKGQKYTIREIKITSFYTSNSYKQVVQEIGILFKEIINPEWIWELSNGKLEEYYFYHARFAPLEEKKKDTDISIFKTILDGVNKKTTEKV